MRKLVVERNHLIKTTKKGLVMSMQPILDAGQQWAEAELHMDATALDTLADRSTVWTVWNCASPEVLDEVTKTLPLYDFWNIEARCWRMEILRIYRCHVIMIGGRTWEKLFSI